MRDTLLLACGTRESRAALRPIFEDNYNLLEAETERQTVLLLEQNLTFIAALLLDLTASGENGTALLSHLRTEPQFSDVPLLVILSKDSAIDEATAFSMGVSDVITQPCDSLVIQSRIRTIVELNRHQWHLQELLAEQADILQHSNDVMVDALSSIIEYRSVESGQHILRIRRFTNILLEEVARSCPEYNLDDTVIRIITSAAALHDIGKIAIPDSILNKPGPLTPEEWEVMRTHALTGCRILESLSGSGNRDYLRYAHNICHYHHERWDGGGYPEGIAGDDIPICAQVVGLADVYDALTSSRVYKEAYSMSQAATMILNGECGLFSPQLLECFKQVSGQMAALARAYADGHLPKSDEITVPLPGPSPQSGTDTLRMTQMRYHALLHHMDVTVAEADLDQEIFHLVYNSDPNLAVLQSGRDFDEIASIWKNQLVYPEDLPGFYTLLREQIPNLLSHGLRKLSHSFRLIDRGSGNPIHYRATIIRLNLNDSTARNLLILLEKGNSSKPANTAARSHPAGIPSDDTVFGSLGCFICCRNDRFFTLEHFSGSFATMLGYTEEELRSRFQNRLIELVVPEDRAKLIHATSRQLTSGACVELEYRLRGRDGSIIWIIDKSRLLTALDGNEYMYGILLDINATKKSAQEMQDTLDRHQIILSQTQNVIFEWSVTDDSVRYFGDWTGIFGYDPIREKLLSLLDSESHFHPEDIPVLFAGIRAMQGGSHYQVEELRLATADGRYLWCRFRATALYDQAGTMTRVVGLITNIDREKRQSQLLLERAERDSLTKLLNKDSARKYVEEYLLNGGPAALIIIDLDNFKQANDRYGHLFGDALLAQVASNLRRQFRADDVVARIGGDEFMVLMKGASSVALVSERCKRLTEVIRRQLESLASNCKLSCSIGVAISPDHGSDYSELFRRADQALYVAKDNGKNQFLIYNADSPLFFQRKQASAATTRIESGEDSGFAESSLIQHAFQQLYESDDLDSAINRILELVGRQMNVSRAYIFENNPENTHCSNTFEWCNEGVRPEIENLQNVSYEEDIPGYYSSLNEHSILYCTDISSLSKDLYDILAPQGIKSMLHCAIRDRGTMRGYVGFDDCNSNRLWTQEQIDTLTFFSEMLSVFLLKKRAQDETARYAADLVSVLDNQNAWIYVIDPEDCTLKFLNAKTRALAPDAEVGMKCYQCLMGLDERCPTCPAANIREKRNNRTRVDNLYLGLSADAESTLITWGGKDSCLLTCRPRGESS